MEGSCEFFDVEPFLRAADILVAADEPLRALAVLRAVPAFYRDNPHPEIQKKINRIGARLATPSFYAGNVHDKRVMTGETAAMAMDGLLRGQLILKDVNEINARNQTAHIFDLGPGEYWLPIALEQKKARFTYEDVGLSPEAKVQAMAKVGHRFIPKPQESTTIFVACEIIEHLHHEEDIRAEYERHRVNADIVHISTPKYTWDGRAERLNWDREGGDLGHLRTYTPKEFILKVQAMFPEFEFQFYDHKVMHLRGVRKNG